MKTLTVSELTFAIKSVLEPSFRSIAVRGEISNFKLQASGHLYFSLKDPTSQISAVLFKGHAANLSKLPKEGDQVIAIGDLSLYAPRGSYQLVIRELQFLGVGELLLKLHELKAKLEALGWFDPQIKKPLPKLPKRIGVVTSPTGAVIQDILNVLTRRFKGFQVILNPVKVQGEGSAAEIAAAIHDMNRYELADVLIVGRGGGSIEDLWAFNEEIVAKAIFESKIPIISAVGHETDFTIADCVADVRAPTPSAAAEIAIAEKANLLKFLDQTQTFLYQKVVQQHLQIQQKIKTLKQHPLFSSPYAILEHSMQKMDVIQNDLTESIQRNLFEKKLSLQSASKQLALLNPSQQISNWKVLLNHHKDRLHLAITQIYQTKKERLHRLVDHLRSINPQNLLKNGYSILFSQNEGSIILSTNQIKPNQSIRALLHDGELNATVESVHHDTRKSIL